MKEIILSKEYFIKNRSSILMDLLSSKFNKEVYLLTTFEEVTEIKSLCSEYEFKVLLDNTCYEYVKSESEN